MTSFPLEARLWLLLAALALDALIGDPDWLWRRLPHPVTWFGALIGAADRWLNPPKPGGEGAGSRFLGAVVIVVLVAIAWTGGLLIERLLSGFAYGFVAIPVIASVFLASRSLHDHVARVRDAFGDGGVRAARVAVSQIVGRDPDSLDEAGVSRAAIESTAENFSDGVVAPALWFAVFGLPGLLAYKMINTADSMIGHRKPRHRAFGWAAARLDDLVNLPASRLSGFLIAAAAPFAGGTVKEAFLTMLDDARKHRSPNAGWPEAAMAGGLGIALAGPRRYGQLVVDDPFLNDGGRHDASPNDIRRALRILVAATALGGAGIAIIALY